MLFKIYYCDDATTADYAHRSFLEEGYATEAYDHKDCATFVIMPNADGDYTRSLFSIHNNDGENIYSGTFRCWRNYLVVFEDNTVITLIRNFSPSKQIKRNRDMVDTFVNAICEKLNPSNAVIIQDDEDFVV